MTQVRRRLGFSKMQALGCNNSQKLATNLASVSHTGIAKPTACLQNCKRNAPCTPALCVCFSMDGCNTCVRPPQSWHRPKLICDVGNISELEVCLIGVLDKTGAARVELLMMLLLEVIRWVQ